MAVTINGSAGVTTNSGAVYDSLQRDTAKSWNWNGLTTNKEIDFTSIPSWVRRITVMFQGVSLSGTSNYLVQIGSGSVTSSGYVSASATIQGTGNTLLTSSAGFGVRNPQAAGATVSGIMTITLISGTTYVASHALGDLSQTSVVTGGGTSPSLSGTLDRVRITTVSGLDNFDAGTINILYE